MVKPRSPVLGYNTNMRHRGLVFHVQTEDSGIANPHLFTHLFYEGVILTSRKMVYDAESTEANVKTLMQGQHKAVLRELKKGNFEDKIDSMLAGTPGLLPRGVAEAAPAPAAAPAPERAKPKILPTAPPRQTGSVVTSRPAVIVGAPSRTVGRPSAAIPAPIAPVPSGAVSWSVNLMGRVLPDVQAKLLKLAAVSAPLAAHLKTLASRLDRPPIDMSSLWPVCEAMGQLLAQETQAADAVMASHLHHVRVLGAAQAHSQRPLTEYDILAALFAVTAVVEWYVEARPR